jgi:hypothetical protein
MISVNSIDASPRGPNHPKNIFSRRAKPVPSSDRQNAHNSQEKNGQQKYLPRHVIQPVRQQQSAKDHSGDEGGDKPVSANNFGPDVGRKCHRQERDTTSRFRHQILVLRRIHRLGKRQAKRNANQRPDDNLRQYSRRKPVCIRTVHSCRCENCAKQNERQHQPII